MKGYSEKLITFEKLFEMIRPGHRIYVSSGPATPVKTIRALVESSHGNLVDLEIIQIAALTDIFNGNNKTVQNGRLKTFTVGETISRSFNSGNVDFIPTTMAEIPYLFVSGAVGIDIAVIQTSMPDRRGRVNLGPVNDISSVVIKKAVVTIAEVNPNVPYTGSKTDVSLNKFDYVIESDEPMLTFDSGAYDDEMRKIGNHVANLVENSSTLSMGPGRISNAIADSLVKRRNLKVYSHVISDWVMVLLENGSIKKSDFFKPHKGIVASSCIGSLKVYSFLHNNNDIEIRSLLTAKFQKSMANLTKLVSIINVKSIDISGDMVQISRSELQAAGFEGRLNFSVASTQSRDGKSIVVLKSLNRNCESNIVIAHKEKLELICSTFGTTRYVVTEYGIANIFGKSIRERCLALIEIAHPDHRAKLIDEAREKGILYNDQIYNVENAMNYPAQYETIRIFKNDLEVYFRPIKASDEDMMRRLFYQFSDEAKYLRYFSCIRSMPHDKMQSYVNIDYSNRMSIVGIIHHRGVDRIIAEGRYASYVRENTHELAFLVDEEFQGIGIASFMLDYLLTIAQKQFLNKLTAFVLNGNDSMLKVLRKARITPEIVQGDGEIVVNFILEEDYQISLNF